MKSIISLLLIIISIGLYFTFSSKEYANTKELLVVKKNYETAIADSVTLLRKRNEVVAAYNSISEETRSKMSIMLPEYVDVVRFMIDLRSLAIRSNLKIVSFNSSVSNVSIGKDTKSNDKQSAIPNNSNPYAPNPNEAPTSPIKPVSFSISISGSYDQIMSFVENVEVSLRIIDISKFSIVAPATSKDSYVANMELKTYWYKQQI